jgi:membrane protein YqaA with SNARE-associated domain
LASFMVKWCQRFKQLKRRISTAKTGLNRRVSGFFASKIQYVRLAALFVVIAITVALFIFRDRLGALETYKHYGYLGAFMVSTLSSASIILPIPGVAVIFALGAVLNPVIVGVAGGVGGGLGELTGYLAGYGGRGVIENRKLYNRMEQWMLRRGSLTIFALAFIPNPFFDLAGFTAGALRFPLWKFLVMCLLGKVPRFVGVALAGAYSIDWVIRFLERVLG